jgi:hypothetical protein
VALQQHPHDSHAEIFKSLRTVPLLFEYWSQVRLRSRSRQVSVASPDCGDGQGDQTEGKLRPNPLALSCWPSEPLVVAAARLGSLSHSDTRIEDISRGVREISSRYQACATCCDLSFSTKWACNYWPCALRKKLLICPCSPGKAGRYPGRWLLRACVLIVDTRRSKSVR